MSRFVLDASVTVAWVFEDETALYTESVLEMLSTGEAVVPVVWPLEVANALLSAERRRRLTRAKAAKFLAALQDLPITVDADGPLRAFSEILSLARERGLSAYDASYLDLAIRTGLPLATLDKNLRKGAQQIGVPLVRG